jgi:hypothetical protein
MGKSMPARKRFSGACDHWNAHPQCLQRRQAAGVWKWIEREVHPTVRRQQFVMRRHAFEKQSIRRYTRVCELPLEALAIRAFDAAKL